MPPWAGVKDNYTGLVWEVKTDNEGIHDEDNNYRWGGATALLTSNYDTRYSDWDVLLGGSNTERLCGFSDWRVPSRNELKSIVNFGRALQAIDTAYFPNTASLTYWSASPVASTVFFAWLLDYNTGSIISNHRNMGLRVRLVRGGE